MTPTDTVRPIRRALISVYDKTGLDELARDESAPAMVMVTHHLEEVPDGFTHALLLREGAIVAAGPVAQVMTQKNLSHTFDMPLKLVRVADRYAALAR